MRRWRMVMLGPMLAGLAVLAPGGPVAADCGMKAPPSSASAYRGVAFVGRVVARQEFDLRYRGRPTPGTEWGLTFAVERPIAGVEGERIRVIGGDRGNCAIFWASEFRVGDRVLLSFRVHAEAGHDIPRNTRIAWEALPWRPDGAGGWRFATEAVQFPTDHPDAARAARTLPAILALVDPDLPDTSLGLGVASHGGALLPGLLGGLAGVAYVVRRRRGRISRPFMNLLPVPGLADRLQGGEAQNSVDGGDGTDVCWGHPTLIRCERLSP